MEYFQQREFLNFPAAPSALQQLLLENLRRNLNVVRAALGVPITITDCFRDLARYNHLIDSGYNPSAKSDHFWGVPVLLGNPADVKQFGNLFIFTAGAVDTVPGMDVLAAFKKIVALQRAGSVCFGQIIFERAGAKQWIHLSNPRSLIFDHNALVRLGVLPEVFMVSIDGGKSYQKYAE